MGSVHDGCKVCRVARDRNLSDIDDRLLSYWKGDATERKGYRNLAEWFNVTVLRREMDRAGVPSLGNEAQAKYDRLEGDDSTTASEVAEILENEGVDVEGVRRDFVSYGVIRTHLKECLDAEREATESDWEEEALSITKEHSRQKARSAIRSLINKGRIQTGDGVTIDVDIRIECLACQARVSLNRALQRGRVCDCANSDVAIS